MHPNGLWKYLHGYDLGPATYFFISSIFIRLFSQPSIENGSKLSSNLRLQSKLWLTKLFMSANVVPDGTPGNTLEISSSSFIFFGSSDSN